MGEEPDQRRDQARGPNLAKVEARSHQEGQVGRVSSGLKDELGCKAKLVVSPLGRSQTTPHGAAASRRTSP